MITLNLFSSIPPTLNSLLKKSSSFIIPAQKQEMILALDKQTARQQKQFFTRDEIPRSPSHVFYNRLQDVLKKCGFDR